jgi:CHAT domain-containing protein
MEWQCDGKAAPGQRASASAPGGFCPTALARLEPENDAIDFHRILLTPDEQHNGYVTAEDLRLMDFHTTRLLVLNICNGGLYRVGPGDEPYGLIASLLTAGVENIISTLWPIDDEMGHYFMIELYKHLLQVGPAEALRQAYLTFIRDRASLNDWASFLLIGTGRL